MPKYLVRGSYTAEGLRGLRKDTGSGRVKAVTAAINGMGGAVEACYFAFGDDDIILVADFPDNVSAAALSITVASAGSATLTITPLLTAEEIDQALEKGVAYTPPGG